MWLYLGMINKVTQAQKRRNIGVRYALDHKNMFCQFLNFCIELALDLTYFSEKRLSQRPMVVIYMIV